MIEIELENILRELLISNQILFDNFEIHCEDFIEKDNWFRKKLVEIEYHVIRVIENWRKKYDKRKESRVRNIHLYVTFESQPMEIRNKKLYGVWFFSNIDGQTPK